jgi:ABC-type sugar transport system substrate-binding protein
MKKVVSIIVVLLSILPILSSCSDENAPTETEKPNNNKVALLYPSNLLSIFAESTVENPAINISLITKELKDKGFQDGNIQKQSITNVSDETEAVKNLVLEGFQSIIFYQLDASVNSNFFGINLNLTAADKKSLTSSLKSELENAQAKGVYLISVGNKVFDYNYNLKIEDPKPNDIANAQLEYLKTTIPAVGNILVLPDATDTKISEQYVKGICKVYKKNVLNGLCDAKRELTGSDYIGVNDQLNIDGVIKSKMIGYLPDSNIVNNIVPTTASLTIDVILSNSDNIAIKATGILDGANIKPKSTQITYPMIIGFSGLSLAVQNIIDEKQSATVINDCYTADKEIVKRLVSHFKNKDNNKSFISPTKVINISNIKTELIDPGYISPGEAGL